MLIAPALATGLKIEPGMPGLQVRRTYTTSDGEIAQVTVNTHPASRFRHSMTMRRVKGSLTSLSDADTALVRLADRSLRAPPNSPHRVAVVDGDLRLDCQSLHTQAEGLAHALLARMPTGQCRVLHAAQLV